MDPSSPNAESCPYAILSVPRNATLAQIKSSYRKMALKHHPDKGGDENMFKIISAAYEILSDDVRRAEHDRQEEEERRRRRETGGSKAASGICRPSGEASTSAAGGRRRRSRPTSSTNSVPHHQPESNDPFSHPFFQRSGTSSSRSSRTQFTDPFDLFERVFGEGFGIRNSSMRGGGLAGHRSSSSTRRDPFDDPFFANSRSMMGGTGSASSMMDEMSQRMDEMHQSMMGSMHSSFGNMMSGGHHHHHHHHHHHSMNGGVGNNGRQSSLSSSFSMSSTSGFGGGMSMSTGFGGGRSVSTSTTTRVVNGVQETITERTVVHPDGRVECSSSASRGTSMGPPSASFRSGNDRHRQYIDQGRR